MNKKRYTIGFLFDFLEGEYTNQILMNIVKGCKENDINFIGFGGGSFNSIPYKYRDQKNVLYNLVSRKSVDGIIIIAGVIGNFAPENEIKELILKYSDIPIVNIGIDIEGFTNILVDNKKGIEEIMSHLIEVHNCKQIAFIKGAENNYDAKQRFDVYKKTLKKYNIPIKDELIVNGNFDYFFGIDAVKILLDERKVNFDALVSSNDYMAIYAMNELQKRGFRIPEDIKITGFDNIELCMNCNPKLTTVKQSFYDLGKISVKTILSILKGEKYEDKIILPVELIIRESCGCSEFKILDNIMDCDLNDKKNKDKLSGKKIENYDELKQFFKNTYPDIMNKEDVVSYIEKLNIISSIKTKNIDRNNLLLISKNLFLALFEYNVEIYDIYKFANTLFNYFFRNEENVIELWKEVLILIGLINQNFNSGKGIEIKEKSKVIYRLNEEFINTFNIDQLKKVILTQLPKLPLKRFYLCLYEDENREYSKILVNYNFIEENETFLNTERFPSKDLIPGGLHRSNRFEYIVMALYFKEENLGYIIFEINTSFGPIYETLSTQIGSSIKGAMLTEEINKHTNQLENKVKERTIELEEANKKLQKLDTLKNDFIANITHDFRSPLTAILNIADLELKSDNYNNESYKIIYNAAIKLKNSIDRLLEIAKMDALGIKLSIREINPAKSLQKIIDYYSSSIIGSGIKIIQKFENTKINNFYSDIEKLEEIIDNILSNAIKFVDPNNGEIIIDLVDKQGSIIIVIEDNGIGIPKEKLDVIFNRFEQIQGGRNSKFRGTGIGLAFARQLIGFLKGKIWADSEGEGKGSKFFIELKKGRDNFEEKDLLLSDDKEQIYKRKYNYSNIKEIIQANIEKKLQENEIIKCLNELNKENEYNYKKGVILIADDDKIIREIIIKYLFLYGYKNFILVSDGKLALESVYKYSPDLIICDYNMPNMKGDQFHNQLLSNPKYSEIPFIFLSAVADETLIVERREKGACAYLKKPIDEKIFIITIEEHLKKHFEHLKIIKFATIDELTQLNNKRSLIMNLKHELAIRKYRDLSLIFFDLDNFKEINDTYGHQAGDKLLSTIGNIIKTSIRGYDLAGRYGGDEFVVILPDTNLKNAAYVADILRKVISDIKLMFNEKELKINSSFGIASLKDNADYIEKTLNINNLKDIYEINNADNVDWIKIENYKEQISEILLKMADMALYKAKKTICNKCSYSPEKNHIFIDNICPKCKSNDLTIGKNKVINFEL